MIITICGQAGSGKTTVGREVARRLGYRYHSIGDIRGEMAKERGLTLDELNRLGETEDFTDREVDEFQRELGKKEDDLVVVGRTGFHFIPHSFKVLLKVDLDEAAKRVYQDLKNRDDESYSSLEETKRAIRERDESDVRRYRKYYDIDPFDESNFDLVIDTTRIPAESVVELILEKLPKG